MLTTSTVPKFMLRALIVEDNAEFSAFLKALVTARFHGAVVEQANDAQQAMQLLNGRAPDIVLMDINLPGGINGLALTERIRKGGSRPPILVLTNHDLPEYRAAAARLGADRFLSKSSSTADEILDVVGELTSGNAAHR